MLQLTLLVAVPAQRAVARAAGTTVILKTAPVDPYSMFTGYYIRLDYEISRPRHLSGWQSAKNGAALYVVLNEGKGGFWEARSVHTSWPRNTPNGSVVIKGRKGPGRIEYGTESYYVPEDARKRVEDDLRRHRDQTRVEVAVGPDGQAALVRVRTEDSVYDY